MPHGPEDDTDGSRHRAGHARQAPEEGTAGAFEDALLVLVPGLRRYSHSLTRTDADGEDLLQDCVETALQRRAQWRGVNLRAWTFTIMTNLYRNRHRVRVRWPTTAIEAAQEIADTDRTGDPLVFYSAKSAWPASEGTGCIRPSRWRRMHSPSPVPGETSARFPPRRGEPA